MAERFSWMRSVLHSSLCPRIQERHKPDTSYDWPGNVRELANVIERAVVIGQPPVIQQEDLPLEILAAHAPQAESATLSYQESTDRYRRELIIKTLQQTNGNRSAAAKLLGLERSYFLKLMKAFEVA
jgi:Nif-specific regulatory protein